MPTDHANVAAAASAGFTRIQGQTLNGEFLTRYEKYVSGPLGSGGRILRVESSSFVSQIDADTKALTSLNYLRNHRYGFAAAGGSSGPYGGSALTVDAH